MPVKALHMVPRLIALTAIADLSVIFHNISFYHVMILDSLMSERKWRGVSASGRTTYEGCSLAEHDRREQVLRLVER
jgi:hypothetical protein